MCRPQTGNATLTVLTSPPTSNQTLLQIIAGEDVVRIEQLIAVFSPAVARVFYERYQCRMLTSCVYLSTTVPTTSKPCVLVCIRMEKVLQALSTAVCVRCSKISHNQASRRCA